jgi:hypothetical protein
VGPEPITSRNDRLGKNSRDGVLLTVLGSYTFGKSLDQSSNLGEQVYPYNYRLTRAPSSFDITHDLVTSNRYDVPFGKLLHHANKLTEGWALSGITRFSTGLPVTLINPNDTALIGSYNNGASMIRPSGRLSARCRLA